MTTPNQPLFESLFAEAQITPPRQLTGEELRDSGCESVVAHTPTWYRDKFINLIKGFPVGYRFTIEEVRELAGDPPEEVHYNCMGGLMRRAAGMNLIVRTAERRKAKRASLRASELSVWRRL